MIREAVAEGRPELVLTDAEREVLVGLLSEMLLEALAPASTAEVAR
jgi:hypothetical protein